MPPMLAEPLVSVILPVYNGEEFVNDALASALSQTYQNLEVIAVNDGSTDGTRAILDRRAATDPRLRVVNQENGGVAKARNRAIVEARGDFIAPLDADDLWLPTKIQRQVQRILEAGGRTGFVYSWWLWINSNGRIVDHSPRWRFEGSAFETLLQMNFTGNASVPLFRRHYVDEVGGYNEELAASGAGGCEDWELALRVAERCEVAVVPEVLLGYRRRPGSMSTALDRMWRSQVLVVHAMEELRPDLHPRVIRRAGHQFALYLSGVAFWSGDLLAAVRWGLRSGYRLPFLVAPYVVRMLFRRNRSEQEQQTITPGLILDTSCIPEPLLPYDKVLSLERTCSDMDMRR